MMLRKSFYLFIVGIIAVGCMMSCSGEDDLESIEEDIEQFILANNINAERTESGLYYEITNEGTGEQATSSNLAVANIRGLLLNGNEWLNTEGGFPFKSLLNNSNIISGLIEGLKLMKTGGEARFIMSPSLGFGDVELNGIPANSALIIDVKDLVIYEDVDDMNDQVLRQYIATNELVADSTDTGLFFTTDVEGNPEAVPSPTSTVSVNYTGYFLDGNVFDSNNGLGPVTFGLDQVIAGWTQGLQLYGEGAKGTLLIPSDLAYGALGNESIPAYTPIIFDIELLEVID